MITTNSVLLTLTNALPAAGTLVELLTADIEDIAGNARNNTGVPGSGGQWPDQYPDRPLLSGNRLRPGRHAWSQQLLYQRRQLSAGIRFTARPLRALALDSGTIYYRDVVFPPGTPSTLNYKYSGQLNTTGTNNYEAVRLVNYDTASAF
jgi:hypothetical protein